MLRGARGAVQVGANEAGAILDGAEKLMRVLVDSNRMEPERVASVMFTVTRDLDAAFPAEVRSRIGWESVPFLCAQEIPVPGSMPRVVRVLILFETDLGQKEIQHQYLGETQSLRPDLSRGSTSRQ